MVVAISSDWTNEPDHVEGTSGPCYGEKGVVGRAQRGRRNSLGMKRQTLYALWASCRQSAYMSE